jgi:hypothetical protein
MSTTESSVEATAAPSATPGVTPPLRHSARRAVFWICMGVVVQLVAIAGFALQGAGVEGDPLSPNNAAPAGSKAVFEVLGAQGVDTHFAESLEEAEDAAGDYEQTTILIYDPERYLTPFKLRQAAKLGEHVVLVDPDFDQLREVTPDVSLAGFADEELDADCDLPAATRAGTVVGEATGFRVTGDDADAVLCFGSGDDVYSLIQLTGGSSLTSTAPDQRRTVLGAWSALTNGTIAREGNAALALNLLGDHETLVWYIPGFDDLDGTGAGAAAAATPPWLTPAIALLMLAGLAAAVWRGRRLGPLVVENLPVTVRASETMLGRARLYERSGSRLRALDALRIGTVQRLAKASGLSRQASVDEVIVAVAALSGRPASEVRALLLDREPVSDPELVQLSDELLLLERDVARAARPQG